VYPVDQLLLSNLLNQSLQFPMVRLHLSGPFDRSILWHPLNQSIQFDRLILCCQWLQWLQLIL
jgi:hypothetical protein